MGSSPTSTNATPVWRILSEPSTLLAHAVGAGKTATMVMAGREINHGRLHGQGTLLTWCRTTCSTVLSEVNVQLYPEASSSWPPRTT